MKKTREKRVEPAFASAKDCKASNACFRWRFYVIFYTSKTGRRLRQPVILVLFMANLTSGFRG